MDMVFIRQKLRVFADLESPTRTQTEIYICEVQSPSLTLFTQKLNEFFVQQVVQDAQDLEREVFHYCVPSLN